MRTPTPSATNGDLWRPPPDRRLGRRKVGLLVAALVLALALAGGIATYVVSRNPPAAFERVKPGMTQAQVVAILGVPDIRGEAESGESCWYWERSLSLAANGVCFDQGRVVKRVEGD